MTVKAEANEGGGKPEANDLLRKTHTHTHKFKKEVINESNTTESSSNTKNYY